MTDIGHNSVAGVKLKSYLERFERSEEVKQVALADQREIMAEAKADGFDTKTMRQLIKLRKMDDDDRAEQEALLDTYKSAVGL